MPLYEYRCPKHGKFEVIINLSNKRIAKCPIKGCRNKVERVEYSIPAKRSSRHGIQ